MPPIGTIEDKIEALVLCFSESSLDKDASHQGLYSNICGNKPLWNEYLSDIGVQSNSILSGYTIYRYYLEENNNNKTMALKEYKGIKSHKNMWIIKKYKRVLNQVKSKHLKEK